MAKTFIYALCDPNTGEIRYVGKANNPERRLTCHLCDRKKSHKQRWIASLKRLGLIPSIKILAEIPRQGWEWVEKAHIRKLREMGYRLTNLTAGGDGVEGRKVSQETRAKLRACFLGKPRSSETKAKISKALAGQKHSPKRCAQKSSAMKGMKRSVEFCAAVRAGLTAEVIERRSAKNRGQKRTAAQRRRISLGNTPEVKASRAEKHRGQKRSAQTRLLMSLAAKARFSRENAVNPNNP